MAEFIAIEGLGEFITDLREAPSRIRRAQRAALTSGARKIITRAAAYAPRRSGALAANTAVQVTTRGVAIVWREPYAGVQEWAVDYNRGGPRGGPVHMTGPPPPRFAYKARDELAPTIEEDFLDDIAEAAASGGWFTVE